MGLIALRCPYCGGQLSIAGFHYECICCGSLVLQENIPQNSGNECESSVKHSLYISGPVECKCSFGGKVHLKFSYRRRVTLADLRPMNVIISANERPISFIDEFDNVGNGILTISVDGHNVLVSKEGRLKAKCNDTVVGPFVECPLGSEITIGSLKLKVE